jgi:hypothetical protein
VVVVGLLAILIVVSLGGTSADAGVQPSSTTARPALRVASVSPFAVAGLGFKPGEHVRIRAESTRKNVLAGNRGRFVVRLAAVDPCNGVVVRAVGDQGSRASIAFAATWRVHCAAP